MPLPPLPAVSGIQWSPNVYNTVQILQDAYTSAHSVLESQFLDNHRLQWHLDNILTHSLPLLQDLHDCAAEENFPDNWVSESVLVFAQLVIKLANAKGEAEGM
jgi:hypothetical protein